MDANEGKEKSLIVEKLVEGNRHKRRQALWLMAIASKVKGVQTIKDNYTTRGKWKDWDMEKRNRKGA